MPFTSIAGGRIEYARIGSEATEAPTIVMLHEGLGSLSMWKDFPEQLATRTRSHVVVYSRHGHGRSATLTRRRKVDYMHDEGLSILPQLLERLAIRNPFLLGHSDGASIALILAGSGTRPVAGVIAMAPHVMVEELTVASIAAVRDAYLTTDFRKRLARHHDDVDALFWAWNDIWLDPAFRAWNIEEYLPRIPCPILALQGEDDEYGTMDQIDRIARGARRVQLCRIAQCRHSPHRDQPQVVLDAVAHWMQKLDGDAP